MVALVQYNRFPLYVLLAGFAPPTCIVYYGFDGYVRRWMDYVHHVIGAVYGTYLLYYQGNVCRASCPAPNLYMYAQTNEIRYVRGSAGAIFPR